MRSSTSHIAAASSLGLLLLLGGTLAAGAAASKLDEVLAQCVSCHGEEGRKARPEVPSISGQPKLFLQYQLFFFREGRRKNEDMNALAKDMSDTDLLALSEAISAQKRVLPQPVSVDRTPFERGAALAQARNCQSCHNADYSGREQMPALAGQQETYLAKSLREYKTGVRVGTQAAMAEVLSGLAAADFDDLAHYLANVRP